MSFLVFQLRAPLASFGSSGTELRLSDSKPRRSAITGLLAAALGIERTEPARFTELVSRICMAVCVLKEPRKFQDLHTVQAPVYRNAASRAAQLRAIFRATSYKGTMVTYREYLQDGHWVIVLHGAAEVLDTWRVALEEPQFTLYLGRKSCVLSAFTAPAVIEAATAEAAVLAWAGQTPRVQLPDVAAFSWDQGIPTALVSELTTVRNDTRTNLMRNHFSPRAESNGTVTFSTGKA